MTALLTEEALGWVGMTIDYPAFVITDSDIRRYAAGLGSPIPVPAKESEPLAAQPLLYTALIRPVVPVNELTVDGLTIDRRAPVGEQRVMFGGIDLELVRPLHAGDRIRGTRRLESLEEKQGKRKEFVLATWKTEYFDADDILVMRETSLQILM